MFFWWDPGGLGLSLCFYGLGAVMRSGRPPVSLVGAWWGGGLVPLRIGATHRADAVTPLYGAAVAACVYHLAIGVRGAFRRRQTLLRQECFSNCTMPA